MTTNLDALPGPLRAPLARFGAALTEILQGRLVGLLVFGSAVRGGWVEGKSDVDLALVVSDTSRPTLLAVADVLESARVALRFECVVLDAGELARAADVFPLFYDDIRNRHVVVVGTDPFASLTIADVHRRLRIEQELREMQIRLRRAVTDSRGHAPRLVGAVERKVRQLRSPLHALLRLGGLEVSDDLPSVLGAAARRYEVAVDALLDPRADPNRALDQLTALLARCIDHADSLEP